MAEHKHKLKKVLSYRVILLITVNSIMGTGIYFLPAVGAGKAGPASIISWLAMALISIYIAMCFGELTSMFPKSGGIYEFCKQAYGRFWSFLIGWMAIIAANVTIAMLVVGAIHYLLPVNLPFVKIAMSLFFIFVFNYVAYKGMKTSATMLVAFAFITVGTLVALIIPGLFKMELGNFTPFFVFPMSAIGVTIFLIAETFFGWETATFLAEETKDGKRVMPKALVTGTVIIAIISMLFVITSLGVINWSAFGKMGAPLASLGIFHYGDMGRKIFTILVYMAIIGSVAGWIVSAPRLILAMANDKLFLSQFKKIHPVNSTPYKAIMFQTVVTTILVIIGSGSYHTLLQMLVPMVLIMYSAVLLCVVVLRFKKPHVKRYYKAPFGKIGPFVAAAFMLSLIGIWIYYVPGAWRIFRIAISLVLTGIPVYFLLQMYYNEKFIIKVNDALAYVAYLTERISLPVKIRKELLRLIGNVRGKSVLEYGCNVGTLTMHLAEEVGKKGNVHATDESKHALAILKKRIEKKEHKHVNLFLDEPNTIHPDVPNIDAVVSAGMIGYVQKQEKVLKQLNKRMKMGARIVFMDYDKFFEVIPNIEWLSNDKEIKKIFRHCGFEVEIKRKRGIAWQYIFIYGIKVRHCKK